MSFPVSESERRQAGMVRRARVVDLDPGKALAKVTFGGETQSAWIPYMALRAGSARVWAPPARGEQVWVLSEDGNTAQGVILGGAFSDDAPAPSAAGEGVEVHLEGASIVVHPGSVTIKADRINLEGGGSSIGIDGDGIRLSGARIDLN